MKVFATTGSRGFQFDRLARAIDEMDFDALSEDADVFLQTGSCSYEPQHVAWAAFLSREEFGRRMGEADLVVTHGGTGAIISAISMGKRVIAVPRLSRYGEAVDDHQVELVKQFDEMGLIKGCLDPDRLTDTVAEAVQTEFVQYQSNTATILESIEMYIQAEIVCGKEGRR